MKCPHCKDSVHRDFEDTALVHKGDGYFGVGTRGKRLHWTVSHMVCPACSKAIISLKGAQSPTFHPEFFQLVYPKNGVRPNAPEEVPAEISEDFNEACIVISDSTKASAALSRRCLQAVLHYLGYKQHKLADAIKAAIDANIFPLSLAENLDAIRVIGNFAAHPAKDSNAAAIFSVEPEEAEWNLDVLEELFDFVYVQPAKSKIRRDKLNEKLVAHGKHPIAAPAAAEQAKSLSGES
jgi:hypothetical protein